MAGAPPLWGWGPRQRAGLAALAVPMALALRIAGPPEAAPVATAPPPAMAIDVNSAPPMALLALPGLGPTRVARLRAARDERPFDSLDDLSRRVRGIGPATIEGIRPFLRLGPDDPPARDRPDPAPP